MFETLLSLIVGMVIGAVAAYLYFNRRYTALHVQAEVMANSLRLQKEQNVAENRLRSEQFQEQLKVVREQFQNLATRILSQTSSQLKSENREAMEHITKPINDNFAELQKAIQESDREAARTAASLTERLRQVGEQAEKMDRTATRLTNALRNDSKQAGDWGELMLQELLDSQGFKRGLDYDIQDTITNQDGLPPLSRPAGCGHRCQGQHQGLLRLCERAGRAAAPATA